MVAVVEREPDLRLAPRVEQPTPLRVLAHHIDRRAAVDPGHDLRPRRPAIPRAIDVRTKVVEPQRVHRRVRGESSRVRRIHQRDLPPRSELRWRHIAPRLPAVARQVDQSVVGPRPHGVRVHVARRDRVDHTASYRLGARRVGVLADARRHRPGLAREIAAQPRPALAAVHRLPYHVRAVVELARIQRREEDRHGPDAAEVVGATRSAYRAGPPLTADARAHVLCLPRAPVEPRDRSAVHDIGVERIGSDIAVLACTHRPPIAVRDAPVIAAARDARRARFLLTAAEPVWPRIVGGHVIELRRRLIVPRAPALPPVDRDHRALVGHEQHQCGIVRVDPEPLVVVATGCPAHALPCDTGIGALPSDDVRRIHRAGIARVHRERREVVAAAVDAIVARRARPRRARVVAPIDAALRPRGRRHIDPIGVARCDRDAQATEPIGGRRQAALQLRP